jgi:GNAT superfamily N-acetyltransferase
MAHDEWRFAPARPADAEGMRTLARAAYEKYVERIGREPGPMFADYETIAKFGQALLVWDGDELIAFLVTELEPDALLVDNVAVSPQRQGTGLGSLLLDRAEAQARTAGVATIKLYTHETMTENLDFYARRGFVETHRATEHGFRRVFMSKPLPTFPSV